MSALDDLKRRAAELLTDTGTEVRKRAEGLVGSSDTDELVELVIGGATILVAGYMTLRKQDKASLAVLIAAIRATTARKEVVDVG